MMPNADNYGVTLIQDGDCGTCHKKDLPIALFEYVGINDGITLCARCLFELANLVSMTKQVGKTGG